MGTNYFAIEAACPNPCDHCRQPEWHIGKSLRMFQAHDDTPWGEIESWSAWKDALRTPGVIIRNEYGEDCDVEEFIADVERVPMDQRRRQYDAVREGGYPVHTDWRGRSYDYLDADGFSFYRGEFS